MRYIFITSASPCKKKPLNTGAQSPAKGPGRTVYHNHGMTNAPFMLFPILRKCANFATVNNNN